MYEILGLSGTRTLKENRILNTRPRVDTISYNVQSKIGYSLWPTTKQPRGDQLKNVTGRNTLGATIFLFLFRRYSSENVRPKEHKYDCIYQAIIRPIVPCAEIHKVGRTNTTIIFATEVFVTYVWLRKTLRMRIVHTHTRTEGRMQSRESFQKSSDNLGRGHVWRAECRPKDTGDRIAVVVETRAGNIRRTIRWKRRSSRD